MNVIVDDNNRKVKTRLALFRALLAMRGAKVLAMEHDTLTIECRSGDEQGVRDLADKFGITLGSAS